MIRRNIDHIPAYAVTLLSLGKNNYKHSTTYVPTLCIFHISPVSMFFKHADYWLDNRFK